MSEPIVIHRKGVPSGGRDAAGYQTVPVTDITVDAIAVAPTSPIESATDSGDIQQNGYTLYLPFGTQILASDTVTVRGESGWQVVGDADAVDWVSPFSGWSPGTVAVVSRKS